MLDTVTDVVAQDLILDAAQGGANGRELGQYINAVTILGDHAGDAAYLALYAAEALLT